MKKLGIAIWNNRGIQYGMLTILFVFVYLSLSVTSIQYVLKLVKIFIIPIMGLGVSSQQITAVKASIDKTMVGRASHQKKYS